MRRASATLSLNDRWSTSSRAEIHRLLEDLARRGAGILVVSSSIPELLGLCNRVAVMYRGTLGAFRPVADLDEASLQLEIAGARPPVSGSR